MFFKKILKFIYFLIALLYEGKNSEAHNGSNSGKVVIDTGPLLSNPTAEKKSEIIPIKDEPVMLFSTLNGYLYRVDKKTGNVLWQQKNEPILQTFSQSMPVLFPDPLDGTLYRIDSRPDSADIVSRLPETIHDLVGKSPMYFSKLLCTGGKKDNWMKIEIETGRKLSSTGVDWGQDHCPKIKKQNGSSFFLGRSEYSLSLKNKSNQMVWNLTYNTYSTHSNIRHEDYNLKHVTSSQSGLVLTINKETRKIIWTVELDSPVVGIYMLQNSNDFFLKKVPLISMSMDTMQLILAESVKTDGTIDFILNQSGSTVLPIVSTLYVGQNERGPYAICSATHEATQIRGQNGPHDVPLLTGPDNFGALVLGHYIVPKNPKKPAVVGLRHRITDESKWGELTQELPDLKPCQMNHQASPIISVGGLLILFGFITYIFSTFRNRRINPPAKRSFAQQISESFEERPSQDGFTIVGNIMYKPGEVIGHGCNGTMVFVGKFDDRDVAVKRIVRASSSTICNKEIEILKRLCKHPNVISYFYSEGNSDFHFIALELCDCSLEIYVNSENPQHSHGLTPVAVLKEIMQGLQFLHSKKIIHRDLKPANVLLYQECNFPPEYRVVISDFGLGKQIPLDRADITKATAMDGTEGWIAPEYSREDIEKVSESVDIFSAGCLFYFVLTKGDHPFGDDRMARQFKIKHSEYNLSGVANLENNTAHCLIKKMITYKAEDRPKASQILNHSLFWSYQKRLQFIVEISDFVDKRCDDIKTLLPTLESKAKIIFRDNWINLISPALMESLRRQRPYRGDQLRDLIRAIRNKKNHFFEMSVEMRSSLGGDLSGYLDYFTTRFPKLLPTLYEWAAENVSHESAFSEFFDRSTRSRALCKSRTTPELTQRSHSSSTNHSPRFKNRIASQGSLQRTDYFNPRYKRFSLSEHFNDRQHNPPKIIAVVGDTDSVNLRPQYLFNSFKMGLAPGASCPDLEAFEAKEESSTDVQSPFTPNNSTEQHSYSGGANKRKRRPRRSRANKKTADDKTKDDDSGDEEEQQQL